MNSSSSTALSSLWRFERATRWALLLGVTATLVVLVTQFIASFAVVNAARAAAFAEWARGDQAREAALAQYEACNKGNLQPTSGTVPSTIGGCARLAGGDALAGISERAAQVGMQHVPAPLSWF